MNPIPATKASELINRIDLLTREAQRYADPNSLEIRRLLREAEDLLKTSPHEGYMVKAGIMVLTGQAEEMRRYLSAARRLSVSDALIWNEISYSLRLGLHSKARESFLQISHLATHQLSVHMLWLMGISCGAFMHTYDLLQKAIKEKINIPESSKNLVSVVYEAVSSSNISEAYAQGIIDIAGELLQRNRVFGLSCDIQAIDNDVFLVIRVNTQPSDAADMTFEFAEILAKRFDRLEPGLCVSFGAVH